MATTYHFIAKAPGTLKVGGTSYRVNAGDVLALPEGKGKLVYEEKAIGHEYLLLISIVSDEKEELAEQSEEVQSESKEEEVTQSEEDNRSEEEIKEAVVERNEQREMPSDGTHWSTVKDYLSDAYRDGYATVDMVEQTLKRFPTYKAVKEEGERILAALKNK